MNLSVWTYTRRGRTQVGVVDHDDPRSRAAALYLLRVLNPARTAECEAVGALAPGASPR